MIKLVSERDEKEIAELRMIRELASAIKELTANILRIIAGAGRSEQLISQIGPVIELHERLLKLTGNNVASEASIDILRSLEWDSSDPRWDRDTADMDRAQNAIVRSALRLLAAEFSEQRPQRAQAETKLVEAIDSYNRAREKFRQARRERRS